MLGTVKVEAPDGGVAVFALDGTLRTARHGHRSPEQHRRGIRVCVRWPRDSISPWSPSATSGGCACSPSPLTVRASPNLGVVPVLEGQAGEAGAPMGIGLVPAAPRRRGVRHRRAEDRTRGRVISGRTGCRTRAVAGSPRLSCADSAASAAAARFEAVAVDDEAGHVYYADEERRRPQVARGPGSGRRGDGACPLRARRILGRSRGSRYLRRSAAAPATSSRPTSCR